MNIFRTAIKTAKGFALLVHAVHVNNKVKNLRLFVIWPNGTVGASVPTSGFDNVQELVDTIEATLAEA